MSRDDKVINAKHHTHILLNQFFNFFLQKHTGRHGGQGPSNSTGVFWLSIEILPQNERVSWATRNSQLVSLKLHTAWQQLQRTSHIWAITHEPLHQSWTGCAGLRLAGSQPTAVVGCKADKCYWGLLDHLGSMHCLNHPSCSGPFHHHYSNNFSRRQVITKPSG